MEVVTTVAACKAACKKLTHAGGTLGFVPTMGALHAGHLSLVAMSRAANTATAVSIFVNPTQFGPNEDFDKYPRTLAADLEKLEAAGVTLVFAPGPEELYHPREDLQLALPTLSAGHEGRTRPTHFAGVALVVGKLFNILQPTRAYFGQKDFQQTRVVKRLAADLFFPVEVVVGPTLREADGLAMSSRNVFLSAEERAAAPAIYQALKAVAQLARPGAPTQTLKDQFVRLMAAQPLMQLDYFDIVAAETLQPLAYLEMASEPVAIVAVYLEKTRLIDNLIF